MKYFIILLGLLVLGGCATAQEKEAQYQAFLYKTCVNYGFEPHTQRFSECMMQVDQARQDRRAFNNAFGNKLPTGPSLPPPVRLP